MQLAALFNFSGNKENLVIQLISMYRLFSFFVRHVQVCSRHKNNGSKIWQLVFEAKVTQRKFKQY